VWKVIGHSSCCGHASSSFWLLAVLLHSLFRVPPCSWNRSLDDAVSLSNRDVCCRRRSFQPAPDSLLVCPRSRVAKKAVTWSLQVSCPMCADLPLRVLSFQLRHYTDEPEAIAHRWAANSKLLIAVHCSRWPPPPLCFDVVNLLPGGPVRTQEIASRSVRLIIFQLPSDYSLVTRSPPRRPQFFAARMIPHRDSLCPRFLIFASLSVPAALGLKRIHLRRIILLRSFFVLRSNYVLSEWF